MAGEKTHIWPDGQHAKHLAADYIWDLYTAQQSNCVPLDLCCPIQGPLAHLKCGQAKLQSSVKHTLDFKDLEQRE